MLDFSTLIYRIPAFLFAISIHEYAHAQCADSLGDPTSRFSGRLTLNPLAHIDPLGAFMLILCGFGWAKPVSVDTRYFKNPTRDFLKVSLAGPGANLFLCFLSMFLLALMSRMGILSPGVRQLLIWMAHINVWFAFFNLLPVPPLDGSRIITMLLPPDMAWKFDSFLSQYGMFVLVALIVLGVKDIFIKPLANGYLLLVNSFLGIFF